jgi:hypothetical protein
LRSPPITKYSLNEQHILASRLMDHRKLQGKPPRAFP